MDSASRKNIVQWKDWISIAMDGNIYGIQKVLDARRRIGNPQQESAKIQEPRYRDDDHLTFAIRLDPKLGEPQELSAEEEAAWEQEFLYQKQMLRKTPLQTSSGNQTPSQQMKLFPNGLNVQIKKTPRPNPNEPEEPLIVSEEFCHFISKHHLFRSELCEEKRQTYELMRDKRKPIVGFFRKLFDKNSEFSKTSKANPKPTPAEEADSMSSYRELEERLSGKSLDMHSKNKWGK